MPMLNEGGGKTTPSKNNNDVFKRTEEGKWEWNGSAFVDPSKTQTEKEDGKTTTTKEETKETNSEKSQPKVPTTTETEIKETFLLEGELQVAITEDTLVPKIGDTIKLDGFGSFLSGDYYIKARTQTISSEGYTLTFTVMKKDYGRSLKNG